MEKYSAPNYRHITRLEWVPAEDALNILATVEMQDRNISDPAEYNKMYDEEMRLGYRVMVSAFESKNPEEKLKFSGDVDGECVSVSGPGDVTFYLQYISLNVVDFCTWASKKGYKLPKELTALLPTPVLSEADHDKGAGDDTPAGKKDKNPVPLLSDNAKTIEGLLKIFIAMAMDCYGYDPTDKKNTTISDIMNALAKCELSVSENTIRDRLKQAQLLLPRKSEQ